MRTQSVKIHKLCQIKSNTDFTGMQQTSDIDSTLQCEKQVFNMSTSRIKKVCPIVVSLTLWHKTVVKSSNNHTFSTRLINVFRGSWLLMFIIHKARLRQPESNPGVSYNKLPHADMDRCGLLLLSPAGDQICKSSPSTPHISPAEHKEDSLFFHFCLMQFF